MDRLKATDKVSVQMTRKRKASDELSVHGHWIVEQWRKGVKIGHYEFPNTVTNAGKTYMLGADFSNTTQIASASWFIGLISSVGYGAGVVAADTMGSHAGWTEFTAYDEATRQAWGPGSPSSNSVTNAAPATFTANADGTVKGIFITSVSTKGGTTGTLLSGGLFPTGDVVIADDDELRCSYAISL